MSNVYSQLTDVEAHPQWFWQRATRERRGHSVQFYEDDGFLITDLAGFVGAAIGAGDSAIVIATGSHREGLARQLLDNGLDLALAARQGRFVSLDAEETLAQFLVNGMPDPERFIRVVGEVVGQAELSATGPQRRVAAFGEMVALLWADGNAEAALALEQLWEDLAEQHTFYLHCAYPMALFTRYEDGHQIARVLGKHSEVLPTEGFTSLSRSDEQFRTIALLQQKARALETLVEEQARLLAVARDEERLIAALHQFGSMITSDLDLEKVVQAVTDAATELTGAQFGAFFYNVVDDRSEGYTLYTISGVPREHFADFPMPRNTKVFEPTFKGEGVVRLDDVTADPRFGQNAPYYGMPPGHLPVCSYLAVPVISRAGEVLGGLFLGHEQQAVFTEKSERLATGIAAQAAVAIDNARLYRNVQRAIQTRDDFLVAAAHDLKTPLTSIKGFAQVLRRQLPTETNSGKGPRYLESLDRIESAATRMGGLIEELLDLAHLEMGRPLRLELTAVDLVALVRQAVAEHQQSTSRHRIRLEATDHNVIGEWDPVRLRRVVDNLLTNAVKFSPDGGNVTVTLACSEQESGVPWATLRVRDRGLGIPEADQPRIFERFHRGRNVVERVKGTGIGLAGARQIIETLGGTITVSSREGDGSTFTVMLPVAKIRPDNPADGAAFGEQ